MVHQQDGKQAHQIPYGITEGAHRRSLFRRPQKLDGKIDKPGAQCQRAEQVGYPAHARQERQQGNNEQQQGV